jgi:hypothetical protein
MALILDLVLQGVQMVLVVAIAPAILGVTRKVKARLLRRIGPPLLQPYRDLWKLMHKEAVLAHNASWLYRVAPYLIFAAPGSPRRWCRPTRPGCCSHGRPISSPSWRCSALRASPWRSPAWTSARRSAASGRRAR